MHLEREKFLNLKTTPARLSVEEAAWYLGFSNHDIPVLVARGLLKPLGRPAQSATKYFASVTLSELRNDTQWLSRATEAISSHWRGKNARKKNTEPLFVEHATK